ncbi:hypothetical protein K437DRAFT_257689 [Tilletiaria anomala UBC 951]|uniref:Uncharacterized protein n=1 Tax=Tilletiaria anomala (strain ATCC 24038 / CBS 436.72 / UBC 951) TaxID=1037660 RepID=A0A066VMA2_TILAU|nr:uncharacterized protein K437DRAFT_257689 [Tilletiaria anomala UBC 951]KDN42842.1 hypothetical protein K437DRAFT_257689 [Tilletiaria anomala UBC 951]
MSITCFAVWWSLFVIDFVSQTFIYCDPMHGTSPEKKVGGGGDGARMKLFERKARKYQWLIGQD